MIIPIEQARPGDFLKKKSRGRSDPVAEKLCLSCDDLARARGQGARFLEIESPSDLLSEYHNELTPAFWKQSLGSLGFVFSMVRRDRLLIDFQAIEFIARNLLLELKLHPGALFRCLFQIAKEGEDRGGDALVTHCLSTAVVAMRAAGASGYGEKEVLALGVAALLHDVGLKYIPEYTINPTGPLPPAELVALRSHPDLARGFLARFSSDNRLHQKIIAQHHECEDGSGYPLGLKGDQILPLAQLLGLAEIYTALIQPSPRRASIPPAEAMKILYRQYQKKFRPRFFQALLTSISLYPPGLKLRLSDASGAEVILWTRNPYRPVVFVAEKNRVVNLSHPENLPLQVLEAELAHPKAQGVRIGTVTLAK